MRTRSLGLGSTAFVVKSAYFKIDVTAGAASTVANCNVVINGTTLTFGVTAGDTASQVAGKIRALSTSGWTTSGSDATAIFTATDTANKPGTFSVSASTSGFTSTTTLDRAVVSTDMYGYYGKYQGIITPNALITLAGITEGTTKNDVYNDPNANITWLKFSHNYKTLFVADRTIHHSISWDHLDSKGLVFGKVVDIGGQKYLLRLLQGANVNPASGAGGANSNDEWDSLIRQFTPNTADSHWWTVDSVNTAGGSRTWVQEVGSTTQITYRLSRGKTAVNSFDATGSTTYNASEMGYRPVLEVL